MSKQKQLELALKPFRECDSNELFNLIYISHKSLAFGDGLIWSEVQESIEKVTNKK